MSRKNQVRLAVFTAGDLSGNLASTPIDCTGLDNICFQIVISGGTTPTGTFGVQMTSDMLPDNTCPASPSWSDLVFDVSPTIATTPDDLILNLKQWPGKFIRLIYTRASGSGSLKATMTAKQVGG